MERTFGKMPAWLLWTLVAIVCWGVWGAFTGQTTKHHDPLGVVAGAVILEAVVMVPFAARAWHARSWSLVVVSLIGLVAYASFFQGIKASHSAPVVVAMAATYPVVTYLIALAFFGERITWRASLGIVLAVTGTALLSTATGAPS